MEFKSLTVVVGANDEKSSLIKTVDTILATNGDDIEKILLVRPEKVSEQCMETVDLLVKKYPLKVYDFVQTRKFVGGAIRDGFDSAVTSHILLLPGDLAIGLDAVPEMLSRVKKEPNVIFKVSRWLNKNSFHGYSPVKKVFNACGQFFLKALFGTNITDFTCPVQIMPTSLYKSIDWQELNYPFLEEMVLVPLRLGTRIEEVPVQCFGRTEGKSGNSVRQTALYLKTALRIRFSTKKNLQKR